MIDEDIIVFDDFLTKSYHKELLNLSTSGFFKWGFVNNISYAEDKETLGYYGLGHNGFDGNLKTWVSNHQELLKPFSYQIMDVADCKQIMRLRLDMTLYNKDNLIHNAHIDFPNQTNNVSCVYYVNETDGDTIIFNETDLKGNYTIKKRIPPKPNRLLMFKGKFAHTGCSPSKHNTRILINSNYC